MQHRREKPAPGETVEQRPVDVLHVLGEDVVEVADRLVEVESEDEPDRSHRSAERERAGAAERRGDGGQDVGEDVVAPCELLRACLSLRKPLLRPGGQRREQASGRRRSARVKRRSA